MNKIIGALWKRDKDGLEYLSGVLSDIRGEFNIAVFPNNFKNADNQPDYNIIINVADRPVKEIAPTKSTTTTPKKNGKKPLPEPDFDEESKF
ncbi:MAG: hypothetical protein NT007_14020 [Candidatus Kapabacteria bacterium]|nr:hypothetical protein [Candidatus Kapabacteria bacterium]